MHVEQRRSLAGASEMLEQAGLLEGLIEVLTVHEAQVAPGASGEIRGHIQARLDLAGFASPVYLGEGTGPALSALHPAGIVFQLQTGNVARAFYDLMKVQAIGTQGRAKCGVLALPTASAASRLGGNLANFERIEDELRRFFATQITIPLLLLGFE